MKKLVTSLAALAVLASAAPAFAQGTQEPTPSGEAKPAATKSQTQTKKHHAKHHKAQASSKEKSGAATTAPAATDTNK